MNRYISIGVGIVLLGVIGGGYAFMSNKSAIDPSPTLPSPVPPTNSSAAPEASAEIAPASIPTPSLPAKQTTYYPMTNYLARLSNRWYGKVITAADNDTLPCGADFAGVHTGDDLEVTNDELSENIPVYAMADGTVRQATTVSGYGGLIVIEHTLNNQPVTAYYGHINLSQTVVSPGDAVTAGQQLTVLGSACSAQTGGERKHLHFAIHQGTTINVRGYVDSETSLNNWLNPKETLTSLQAQEPLLQ